MATAGSVDDGKSTLIGRLLYDTKSITKDKLEAVEASSKRKGLDFVDLSLLTDGLIAEREQGITIDVAHIYFSTENRKYIVADTPGHVEYTRNMITGASNAEASIVLVDARNGVSEQTRRHLFISSLLEIDTVMVAVNKMDLVNYDEARFLLIKKDVGEIAEKIGFKGSLHFIPLAAKYGDNVVSTSVKMAWYKEKPLLEFLENLPVHKRDESLPARFHVQYVIRPHSEEHHDFRGYAGKLISHALIGRIAIFERHFLGQDFHPLDRFGGQVAQLAEARDALAVEQQYGTPAVAPAGAAGLRRDRVEQFGDGGRPGGADVARVEDVLGRNVANYRSPRPGAGDDDRLFAFLVEHIGITGGWLGGRRGGVPEMPAGQRMQHHKQRDQPGYLDQQ